MSFHIFHISEAYTNADGTLQFIEFNSDASGQQFWANHSITATQGGTTHTLNITQNLPGDSGDKYVLVATQAFVDLTGIAADYIIPANFLFTSGTQTINFPGMDAFVGVTLPTNGRHSVSNNGGPISTIGDATPTNFAGAALTSTAKPFVADPLDDQLAGNGSGLEFVVPVGAFVDLTGDDLTYTAKLADDSPLPAWLTFVDSFGIADGTGTLSFDAGTATPGSYSVKVTATDTLGGFASDVFSLTILSGAIVTGTAGADSLTGTANDDLISGLAGDDTIDGGSSGNDTISGGAGTDELRSSISVELPADVENLVFTGVGNLEGLGNGLANLMIGNAGNNELDGAGGNDSLYGGGGNDTFTVGAGDTVIEGEDGGDDLVLTSVQIGTLFGEVENLTLLGSGSFNLTGNDLANTLTGNDGNNVLNGGTAGDAMLGGLGNDTYHVDDVDDTVSETGAGTDVVNSSVSFNLAVGAGDVLAGDVARLFLTGGDNIDGTGNALANLITGNSGNNVLDGADGDDSLNGGVGNDTLDGATGSDTLKGGTGADAFMLRHAVGTDKLSDFQSGVDQIRLDNVTFTALVDDDEPLDAANAQFALHGAISDTSGDGDDFIKYATDTGELYYDANGSAAGGLSLIAVIDPSCGATVPQLALADIFVI